MRYFAPPTPLALHSDFTPEECERRLRRSIDAERPTMFGFSGYRGSKPFLGALDGKQFRVLQRIYSGRNTLPTVLTGEFQPQETGTRVNGTFDLETTSKIAISLFTCVGLSILIPIVFISHASHPVLSAIFVCGYGGLLLFGPRIFRGIGLDQEKDIAGFLKETLAANDDRTLTE
jgi:hypothetical protein